MKYPKEEAVEVLCKVLIEQAWGYEVREVDLRFAVIDFDNA